MLKIPRSVIPKPGALPSGHPRVPTRPEVLANVAMTHRDDEDAEITSAIAMIDQSLALNPSSARG
jgi:hypothetical protein